MRRSLLLVASMIVLSALVGCKAGGVTVQDNMYDALGGQILEVDESFTYIGHTDPDVITSANGDRMKKDNGIVSRGDVFIYAEDGRAREFVIIQRLRIKHNRWFWRPGGGKPVTFGDRDFKEASWVLRADDDSSTVGYLDFIREQGYDVEDSWAVRSIVRNANDRNRVAIIYGAIPDVIPTSALKEEAAWNAFLADRFEQQIQSAN